MKFSKGDQVYDALVTTLIHELMLAREEYAIFKYFKHLTERENNVINDLNCYRAYSEFIRHIYEYYLGIFHWNDLSTKKLTHDIADKRMNDAANRVINFSRHRKVIEYPDWPKSIQEEFGKDFRTIRNRSSHTDYRRALKLSEITLADFYQKYNRYIDLLFEHACFAWTPKDLDAQNWHDIGNFGKVIRKNG